MKKILTLVIACITFLQISAQTNKAKALLDEVLAKTKASKNITIDFKYSLYNPKENIKKENSGKVIMEGNKYILNFMGITKLFDGKKVYTIVPEDEEITISNHDENDANALTPQKILTFFQKGFTYTLDITQKVGKQSIQYVKLKPINTKDTRKEILIGINKSTKQVYNVMEIGKNGTRTTLTVSSYKSNQKITPNTFVFNKVKYPNYYINKAD